jgi:hypothetical protein
MSYKSGEIYFVRETILGTSDVSAFVKIGLVAEGRSSESRLKEHQTGNPRRLFNQEVVLTDSVHRVEAVMHRLFAPYRISGEWFEFNDESLVAEAINKVKDLASEMLAVTPQFIKAEELATVASSDEVKVVTNEITEIVGRWADAKSRLKFCGDLQAVIKGKLLTAIESGVDTKGAAKATTVTFKPKFSEAALKADDEGLWSRYITYVPTWSARFTNSISLLEFEELNPEFKESLNSLKETVTALSSTSDAYLLNEPQLQLTMLEALAQWDFDLADAELRISVGEAASIEGVCKWGRKPGSPKAVFDEERFALDHEELWTKYTLTKDSFTKLSVTKSKN